MLSSQKERRMRHQFGMMWMAVSMAACGGASGEWEGACDLALGSKFLVYEVTTLVLENGSDDALEGTGQILAPESTLGEGAVSGSADGDELDFLVRFSSGLSGDFKFEGTVDGAEMSGECSFGSQFGRFELSRVN
jgi:hypothetical protein